MGSQGEDGPGELGRGGGEGGWSGEQGWEWVREWVGQGWDLKGSWGKGCERVCRGREGVRERVG